MKRLLLLATACFEVVPRLSGGNVFLEIAPQRENFAPGNSGAIQSDSGDRRIWVKVEELR